MKTCFKAAGLRVVGGLALAVFPLLAMTGCSHGEGPSESRIAKALTLKLPDGLKVSDVDIQVAENEGTKVEPRYETRSNIELEFTDDIYKVVGHLGGEDVVKKIYSRGDDIKGVLVTSATPQGDDAWNIQVDRIDIPDIDGTAKSKFQPGSYVEQGSNDYDDLKAKLAQAQKQAQEQAQKAAEAEAKAKTERIDALRKALVGSWIARGPAIHDGALWATRDGHRLGIELVLDATNDTSGQGTGVIYDFQNPGDQISVPVGYVMDDSGQFATISFARDVTLKSVDFEVGSGGRWRMTPDGKLTYPSGGNSWILSMEKNGPALAAWNAKVDKYERTQKKIQALALKYSAANATGTFDNLPLHLSDGQWGTASGMFLVVGRTTGDVWGDHVYGNKSDVATAAVHAGLLKPGQAGVIEVTYTSRNQFRVNGWEFRGTTRNGVTSRAASGWRGCTMRLVEAAPLD